MAETRDHDLRLALDALDARQVPPAAPGWEARLRDALRAQPRRTRGPRVRLLIAACVAVAVFVLLASGAGAWVGLPDPFGFVYHHLRPPAHKPTAPPQPSPSAAPSTSPSAVSGRPSPGASLSGAATSSPAASPLAQAAVPPSWPLAAVGRDRWHRRESGTHAGLSAVDFVDAVHGWVVGGPHGTVLSTSDGGVTWTTRASGYRRWLSGVAFGDAAHGWAVGTGPNGTVILATTDGGVAWSRTHVQGWFGHVTAVDAAHVWAAGRVLRNGRFDARVMASSDGRSWQVQRVNAVRDLTAISFVDTEHGWTVDSQAIVSTSDGGVTWRTQKAPAGLQLETVFFLDALHGWAAGMGVGGSLAARAVVLGTSDGGATWRRLSIGSPRTYISSLSFADPLHGWATAEYGPRTLVLATTDGGVTWRTQRLGGAKIMAVAPVSSTGACAVGWDGAIYTTTIAP